MTRIASSLPGRRALISFRMHLAVEVSGLTIMAFCYCMLAIEVDISQFPRYQRPRSIFLGIYTKRFIDAL